MGTMKSSRGQSTACAPQRVFGLAVTKLPDATRIVMEVQRMTSIVLDSQTAEKLRTAGERIELRDAGGKKLGYFLPSTDPAIKAFDCPFSDEEIEKFRQERGGRSLQEIMADLRKLA
jgi:hypothetical protein